MKNKNKCVKRSAELNTHTHTHTHNYYNERRLQCSFLERWCHPLGLARGWL